MLSEKIFFVGFPKTGTTSVKKALRHLGLRVCGLVSAKPGWSHAELQEAAHALVPKFDAFQNCPWALLYRELDEVYPDSKFVLTYREDSRWLRSVTNHFGGRTTVMRELVFGHGDPVGHKETYLKVYQTHNAAVRAYFAGRDNFLEFGLTQGDGWEKLCPFLEQPVPDRPFPHANRRIIQTLFDRRLGRSTPTTLRVA